MAMSVSRVLSPVTFLTSSSGASGGECTALYATYRKEWLPFVAVNKVDRFFSDSSGEVAFFADGLEATIDRVVPV